LNIRNCKECGKIFQYDGISKLCYQCRKKDDERFNTVKQYLYENPKSSIEKVSEETGVSKETILRYLREGRLEIAEGTPGLVLDCERCGVAIRTGRYCKSCATAIERGMKAGFERPEKDVLKSRDKDKMYIAELKKKK